MLQIYWIYLLSVVSLLPQNEQEFKTVYLKNREYVKIPVSSDIPINLEEGEDITSQKYGFPKMVSLEDIPENFISVGLNRLEIAADINNHLEKDMRIDKIQLVILNRHTASLSSNGSWNLPVKNQFFESVKFEIDDEHDEIVVIPKELFLKKSSEEADRRIHFEVETLDNKMNTGKVIEFQIKLTASGIGSNQEKIIIKSDKNYFLAAK